MSRDDTWTCPNCKQPQYGATKKIGLWNVPEILVLHLKRFKQVSIIAKMCDINFNLCCVVKDGAIRAKLQSLVEFPLDGLDMSPYLEKRIISKSCSLLPRDDYLSQAMLSRAASQLLSHEGIPDKRKNKKTFGNTLMRKLSRSPNSATLKSPTAQTTSTVPMSTMYDLYAVCNHMGNMNSGHYTAFCRNQRDGQWYSYDDTQVNPISESKVVTNGAYMLFYSRRTPRPQRSLHWSYTVAKHVLFSAVATRSQSSHLLGGGHLPAKTRLESTSSLPATYLTGRKTSESAMLVPPMMSASGSRSNWFNPQLDTVSEVANNPFGMFLHQASQTSTESVQIMSPHQKSSSYDQNIPTITPNDDHRRSRSFEATKQPRECLSPVRSDIVRERFQDWSYHSYTLPTNQRNKAAMNGSLHLPQRGAGTCV